MAETDATLFDTTFDDLFQQAVKEYFIELLNFFGDKGWLWIKAQCWQESNFNPNAVSPAGARGLMQLMPQTDMFIDKKMDGFDPEGNVNNGVIYLATQFRRLREIPHITDRLKAAQASYNGGRGYINRAMEVGRIIEGAPGSYFAWNRMNRRPGIWQTWDSISHHLASPECYYKGLWPDHSQMLDYVEKISKHLLKLQGAS